MSYENSCHLRFHVILGFKSIEISCHLRFYVILVIIVIIVTKVIMALMLKVVIKEWETWFPWETERRQYVANFVKEKSDCSIVLLDD